MVRINNMFYLRTELVVLEDRVSGEAGEDVNRVSGEAGEDVNRMST